MQAQEVYARWLDRGTKIAFAVCLATLLIYLSGALPPYVALQDLTELWTLPLAQYLERTGAPTGWGWLAFLGYAWTPWIFTLLALVELVTDQLPATPSRTVPVQFGARIVMGALCGGAIGASAGSLIAGAVAGIVGAVIGTLAGRAARASLAATLGKDRPAAIIEDAVAIAGAFVIVMVGR